QARNAKGKTIMTWKRAAAEGVNLKSIEPIDLSITKLTVEEPAQQVTQATGQLLGLIGRIAKATGHENTARRAEQAGKVVTQDIVLEGLIYQKDRFAVNGKGTDTLGTVVLEALNKVFAKKD
ncbi:MAG: hypothetical protein ACI4SV_06435, partial [Duodenibacillus sp.]